MTTYLIGQEAHEAPGPWLDAADLERVTGFVRKPQGLCKGDVCVPVRPGAAFVDDAGAVDAAAFWRHLGHPVATDDRGEVFALGEGAGERTQALATLEAPDFSLPDAQGRPHALRDYRGKKVLIVTWGSW